MNSNRSDRPSDEESQALFLRLFLSSERELFRYVAALVPNLADAEEVVQQTAVTLWKKFDQFDRGKPFTPWACGFAINIVKQWAASRKRWQSLLQPGLAEELTSRRAQLRPQFDNLLRHLDHCLEQLPAAERDLVEAYYFRRQSVDAIAAESRRSVDAVYKTLQRIRSMLRQCIDRSVRKGETLA
ncbi:MAG: sigma-70 family RNA polymerase sigma factor [Planctomycetes bacterium]|nr:sigma-70 family RNA polymerase sigma factor [Planctomycetota bacterium]